MSLKNMDNKNRWRSKTVGFRVSPEEDAQIETAVRLNPRVYKALRDRFAAVLGELRRIEAGAGVDDELLDTIELIAAIMDGMKEECE